MNKYLAIFLFSIVVIWVAFWQVIQSEIFAGKVSQEVTKLVEKKLGASFSFKKLEIKVLPPGIEFESVKLKGLIEKKTNIDISVKKVRLNFAVLDHLSEKISIDEVLLEDGDLSLSFKNKKRILPSR